MYECFNEGYGSFYFELSNNSQTGSGYFDSPPLDSDWTLLQYFILFDMFRHLTSVKIVEHIGFLHFLYLWELYTECEKYELKN